MNALGERQTVPEEKPLDERGGEHEGGDGGSNEGATLALLEDLLKNMHVVVGD